MIQESMSLKYQPSSEPLHISAKWGTFASSSRSRSFARKSIPIAWSKLRVEGWGWRVEGGGGKVEG